MLEAPEGSLHIENLLEKGYQDRTECAQGPKAWDSVREPGLRDCCYEGAAQDILNQKDSWAGAGAGNTGPH